MVIAATMMTATGGWIVYGKNGLADAGVKAKAPFCVHKEQEIAQMVTLATTRTSSAFQLYQFHEVSACQRRGDR